MLRPVASRMTRDEFLVWDSPTELRWQLIDGEAVEMAPTSQVHAFIQAELGRLLGNHLVECGSPCRVAASPGIVPRVRADLNFRIPDLGVTCAPDSSGLFVNEPLILVEILCPSNETVTRANVWAYSTIPSVRSRFSYDPRGSRPSCYDAIRTGHGQPIRSCCGLMLC